MTLLQSIDVLMSVGLAMIIGHKIGYRRGKNKAEVAELNRLRDAAIAACIANHPAGKRVGELPALRVVKD